MYSESTGWKELPPLPTARLRSAVVAGRNMQNSLMVTMGDKIPPVENQVVCWTKGHLFCLMTYRVFGSMSNMCKRSHMIPKRAADWLRAA